MEGGETVREKREATSGGKRLQHAGRECGWSETRNKRLSYYRVAGHVDKEREGGNGFGGRQGEDLGERGLWGEERETRGT